MPFKLSKSRSRSPSTQRNPPLGLHSTQVPVPEIPRHGVTVSILKSLLLELDSQVSSINWTTTEVCDRIVIPATKSLECSYAELLLKQDCSRRDIGEATHFVSHAWRYVFADVVGILQRFLEKSHLSEHSTFFWFDMLVVNQHGVATRPQEWWSTTFKQNIRRIKHTVAIFDPWHTPIYISRAWCLWELYCTLSEEASLEILIPEHQSVPFMDTLINEFGVVMNSLCRVDVSLATAWNPKDLEMILEAVRKDVGISRMNAVITEHLRKWFAEISRNAVECEVVESEHTARVFDRVASLFQQQARYDESLTLFQRALDINESIFGCEHQKVATSLNNLAQLLKDQGRFEEAQQYYIRAIGIWEKTVGEDHPWVATGLDNLASLLSAQGKYELATPLFHRAITIDEEVLGPDHSDLASALISLAELLRHQGRYREAKPLYERGLRIFNSCLEENHPSTATALGNLALVYYNERQLEEAKGLLKRSLVMREKVFGMDHPDVAQSLNNLAMIKQDERNLDEAAQLFHRALQIDEKVFGKVHPAVATDLNNLAGLLFEQRKFADAKPLFQNLWKFENNYSVRIIQMSPNH